MAFISESVLAKAITAVRAMDIHQRELLADEIYANQPQLLTAVISQQRFGASFAQIEILLNLLLVSYQAMKVSGAVWQTITEDMQERCIARLTGGIRFIEGLAPKQVTEATSGSLTNHKEKWLLAYVLDELGTHGLRNVQNETEKYLVLTALSLVECIAEAGIRTT
ncbi:MAG: hypothetical protein ABI606_22445 [Rhodoferax sp.]